MKKLVLLTGIILIICTVVNGLYTTETFAQTEANLNQIYNTETTTSHTTYIIKSLNGVVAVYIKEKDEPYIVTETRISNLPKSDAKQIENGIEILGDENLRKTLEDICS